MTYNAWEWARISLASTILGNRLFHKIANYLWDQGYDAGYRQGWDAGSRDI